MPQSTHPDSRAFYAQLVSIYHLIYPDWEASMERQAHDLDSLMCAQWGKQTRRVLDLACGIGTQALGLARLGYEVCASDLSAEEVERARTEAEQRSLSIDFSVCDMRKARSGHIGTFDVVLACDNAIAHLLSNEDLLVAFRQFYECLRPGGGALISVRDYATEDMSGRQIKPYGIRDMGGARWLLWQVWEPRPPHYDVSFYFVRDEGQTECQTFVARSTLYAVGTETLLELFSKAGFVDVRRIDGQFFQPVIVGTRP